MPKPAIELESLTGIVKHATGIVATTETGRFIHLGYSNEVGYLIDLLWKLEPEVCAQWVRDNFTYKVDAVKKGVFGV